MIRRPVVFVWYSLGMPSFSLSGIKFFSKYINKICLLLPKESSFCSVHASCKIFTFQSPLSSLLLVKIQIYVENLTFSVVFYPLWKGDVGLGQLEHSCTLALDVSQDIFQAGEMSCSVLQRPRGQQQARDEPGQEQACLSPSPRLPATSQGSFPLDLCTPIPWGIPPLPPLPASCLCRAPDTFGREGQRAQPWGNSHNLHVLASRLRAVQFSRFLLEDSSKHCSVGCDSTFLSNLPLGCFFQHPLLCCSLSWTLTHLS